MRNESRTKNEVRGKRPAFLLVLLALNPALATDPPAESMPDRDWCVAIGVPGAIALPSRTLIEIPDVTDESLRRANLQLSTGCRPEVRRMLESRLAENPNDPQLLYVLARYVWITAGTQAADQFVNDFIEAFPDFVSARVLLAGVRIDQGRFDDATLILDGLGPGAADYLWVYLNRLRIRVGHEKKDEEAYELLYQVVENDRFPPNARDTAVDVLRHVRYFDPDFQIPLYRIPLTYRSGSSYSCKLSEYAFLMTERLSRFAEAIETLENYLENGEQVSKTCDARMLLGYAYLVLAAEIAAGPTEANRAYVDRADELLTDGGYEKLVSFLKFRPSRSTLAPFLTQHFDPDATDEFGRSKICNALMLWNSDLVETELARGADPNGICEGESLVGRLVSLMPHDQRAEQEHILRLLLKYGGKDDNLNYCDPAAIKGCTFYLYPIFHEFGIK